jgi:N-acetyltransferase
MSRGKGKVLADASSDMEDAPPSSPTLARKRQRDSPKEKKRPLGPSDANRPEKQGTLKGFFAPIKRARVDPRPSSKSSAPPAPEATPSRPSAAPTPASKTRLHQLQFMSNAMQTCTECGMSYLRGTDDADHARHHARVTRGIPWTGRKEARVLHDGVPLSWRDAGPNKFAARRSGTLPLLSTSSRTAAREYRVLALDASTSGRLIFDILYTVDTVLSAPALPPDMLARCKLFLAVTACEPPATPGAKRRPGPKPKEGGTERVVGVVVAQPIKWAMRVLRDTAADAEGGQVVDSGDGVMCE